ncbi:MAG: diphosphomevalonate decarboxylase [Brumimicrobium sp.]|nr:diphosphomevalonate decarboxylase [Brumimicrobium sp.]
MKKSTKVRFPSNIALVKYWGKHGNQLPMNASLSLTLQHAYTELELEAIEKNGADATFEYFFEGVQNDAFGQRVLTYLQNQPEFAEFLHQHTIKINSHNSFPHSTGIASSASAFAAIAAAFAKTSGITKNFSQEISRLARLGSGSACRSIYGPFASWGKLDGIDGTSDEYASPVQHIHPNFQDMQDAILIIEDTPKKVSSSVGHGLMKNHPFAEARFKQANQHCIEMFSTLERGDFERFIGIVEREALSLHAMMMTSEAYYLLIRPNTIEVMEKVMQFRQETQLPICFTLDAGPNIHLLYPSSIQDKVLLFIANELKPFTKNILYDRNGIGGIFL